MMFFKSGFTFEFCIFDVFRMTQNISNCSRRNWKLKCRFYCCRMCIVFNSHPYNTSFHSGWQFWWPPSSIFCTISEWIWEKMMELQFWPLDFASDLPFTHSASAKCYYFPFFNFSQYFSATHSLSCFNTQRNGWLLVLGPIVSRGT